MEAGNHGVHLPGSYLFDLDVRVTLLYGGTQSQNHLCNTII